MSNVARFLVGNVAGRIIAELTPEIDPISWRLSDVGQVRFSLAKSDPKATADNLRFGNRVLIEFDNGLPNWGGIIDPPRDWSDGRITCVAYSGEYIFGTRMTGKNRTFDSATVGDIFQKLIEEANAVADMGIELGTVQVGGVGYTVDYHFEDLLSIFRKYLTDALSDADFYVGALENNGVIVFTANLYDRRGADKLNYALMEGRNIDVAKYSEQGKIVNVWDVAGNGNDWGDDRAVGHAYDASSIGAYGYRQDSAIDNNLSVVEQLDAVAEGALGQSKDPHNMISLQAMNLAPATFGDYDVGDWLRLIAYSVGFSGLDTTVRIIGRAFNPGSGTCELVVREER